MTKLHCNNTVSVHLPNTLQTNVWIQNMVFLFQVNITYFYCHVTQCIFKMCFNGFPQCILFLRTSEDTLELCPCILGFLQNQRTIRIAMSKVCTTLHNHIDFLVIHHTQVLKETIICLDSLNLTNVNYSRVDNTYNIESSRNSFAS